MAFGDTSFTLASNTLITASPYLDAVILIDATSAPVTLTLDTPANFGVGVVGFKKIDLTSNLVQLVPASGVLEDNQTSLPLSLEGDAALMQCNGSKWDLIGPGLANLRHSFIPAEHDITIASYNILPSYNGYLMLPSTSAVGNWIMMVLPPMAQAAFGHQCFCVGVMNFDGVYGVSVVSQAGEPIVDPRAVTIGASWKIDLPPGKPQRCLWFWTDGARWLVPMNNGV